MANGIAKPKIRPGLIAPLIPTWGLLAFFGTQQLAATRWFKPFLAFMALLFCLLFFVVIRQALSARRLRRATRKMLR